MDEYDYDDSMDGDWDSGMASAGWGTDEDYGYYGGDAEDASWGLMGGDSDLMNEY